MGFLVEGILIIMLLSFRVVLRLIIPSCASGATSHDVSSSFSPMETPTSSSDNDASPTDFTSNSTNPSTSPTDPSTSPPGSLSSPTDSSTSPPNSSTSPTTELSDSPRSLEQKQRVFRGVDYTFGRIPAELREKPLLDFDLTNLHEQYVFMETSVSSVTDYKPLCKDGDTTLVIQTGSGSTLGPLYFGTQDPEYQAQFTGPKHPYLRRLVPGQSANPYDVGRTRPQFVLHIGNLRLQYGARVDNMCCATYTAFVSIFPDTKSSEPPTDKPLSGGLWLMFNDGDDSFDEFCYDTESEDDYPVEETIARYPYRRQVCFDKMFGGLPHFSDMGAFDLACVLHDWKDLFRGPMDVDTVAQTMRETALCIDPQYKITMAEDFVNSMTARARGHQAR